MIQSIGFTTLLEVLSCLIYLNLESTGVFTNSAIKFSGVAFACVYVNTESEEINLTEILLPNVFSVLINEDGKIGETERALTHIDRYVNEFGFEPNVYLYTGI